MAEGKPLNTELIAGQLNKLSRTADGRGFAFVNLTVEGQEVDDIAEIAKYAHLRNVSLKQNIIADLTPLAQLTYIITLDVSANQVKNLDCFNDAKVLPHCRTLDCSQNALESVGQLALRSLVTAKFRGNQIASLEGFVGNENLQELDLGENKLTSCAGVALESLTVLKLDKN